MTIFSNKLATARAAVETVAHEPVSMHLAIHRTATDMQTRRGGADIPSASLERALQRVTFRTAQYALAVRVEVGVLNLAAGRGRCRAAAQPIFAEVVQSQAIGSPQRQHGAEELAG